jgi:hypothetical protein
VNAAFAVSQRQRSSAMASDRETSISGEDAAQQ